MLSVSFLLLYSVSLYLYAKCRVFCCNADYHYVVILNVVMLSAVAPLAFSTN
jgi:hypothetical protein